MKIRSSKLAVMLSGCRIVGARRKNAPFVSGSEMPQRECFAIDCYSGAPVGTAINRDPRHPLEAALSMALDASVLRVLSVCANPKVLISIIKRVAVYMIDVLGRKSSSCDEAMHFYDSTSTVDANVRACLKPSIMAVKLNVPREPAQLFKSMWANLRELALRKRDQAVGWIRGCHARSSEAGRLRRRVNGWHLLYSILIFSAALPPLSAQTGALQGHSYLGGTQANTSGLKSINYFDGIIPSATITVYLTGTQTLATIYSNSSGGTLSNPFTSNNASSTNPGGWIFWAAVGQGYDVVMSGGIPPNTYPSPVTLTSQFVGSASAIANITNQALNQLPLACTATSLCAQSHVNEGTAGTTQVTQALSAKNMASIGPRYDVTQFGAVGNGIVDDTAAIQAAFTACYNNGGGTVEFPGPHTYLISGTVYLYDSCRPVGERGYVLASIPSNSQPLIYWAGPNTQSNTASVTSVTIINNQTAGTPLRTAMDPSNRPTSQIAQYQIQATASNNLASNEWVFLSGCTYPGLNNVIAQVSSSGLSSTTFTALYNGPLTTGTYSETCTATQATVMFAFDSEEHETDTVDDLIFSNHSGSTTNTPAGVDLYWSGRADSGNNISRVQWNGAHYAGVYYSDGAEDLKFEDGTRSDTSDYYQVIFRVGGTDRLTVVNSQFGSGGPSTSGASTVGGAFLIDNASCLGNVFTLNLDHMVIENDFNMTSGLADFAFLDCPTSTVYPQFKFRASASGIVVPASITGATVLLVSPSNDFGASIDLQDSEFVNANNTANTFVGLPYVSLFAQFGSSGYFSNFHYFPSLKSWGITGAETTYTQPAQILGDADVQNLFQFTVPGSLWLNSDTGFAALPSGTPLAQGTVLAPPAYFNCGTGSACARYAVDVVQSAGTVGTLNGGSTTCSTNGVAGQIVCSSVTGLMAGQYITTAAGATRIQTINATNPSAVVIQTGNGQGTYTNQPLSYTPPVLGKEIQMPTKVSAAPTTGTWIQGDIVWNSGATSGGTIGWQCVAGGTPGTWVALTSSSGGGDAITSPNSTLSVGGTSSATTLDINLGHANTYTATQTFPNGSIPNSELANSSLTFNGQSVSLGAANFGNWVLGTPVSLDLAEFTGTLGETTDTGIVTANVTQTTATPSANQICVFGSTAKTCTPTTTLPTAAFPAQTGDVTNTAGSLATTVGKINGGTVPISTPVVGTNSSGQPVAGTTISAVGCEEGQSGSGTALTTGVICYRTMPKGCTLTHWDIQVDSGTATVQTWKVATGTANPTSGNSISTSGVSISTGTAIRSSTLTDFTTTSFAAGDLLAANLGTVSGADYIAFQWEFTCAQ